MDDELDDNRFRTFSYGKNSLVGNSTLDIFNKVNFGHKQFNDLKDASMSRSYSHDDLELFRGCMEKKLSAGYKFYTFNVPVNNNGVITTKEVVLRKIAHIITTAGKNASLRRSSKFSRKGFRIIHKDSDVYEEFHR